MKKALIHIACFLAAFVQYDNPIFAQTVVNVRDYGAKGDGVTDDIIAFDQALHYSIIHSTPLIIPNGNYRWSRTWNIKDSTNPFVTVQIKGQSSWWDSRDFSVIFCDFVSGPGINIQKGKGCSISGLRIYGRYHTPAIQSEYEFYNRSLTDFEDKICPQNYTGIAIDYFPNPDGSISGSSGCSITNCEIDNFFTGISTSQNGTTFNAENLYFGFINFRDVAICFKGNQAQEKLNTVYKINAWGDTYEVFNISKGNWNCDNINIAGHVVKIMDVSLSSWNSCNFSNIFAETIGQLGYISCSGTNVSLEKIQCDFISPQIAGYRSLINTVGKSIDFSHCTFRYNGEHVPLAINSDATFDNVVFSASPVNINPNSDFIPNYVNCHWGGGDNPEYPIYNGYIAIDDETGGIPVTVVNHQFTFNFSRVSNFWVNQLVTVFSSGTQIGFGNVSAVNGNNITVSNCSPFASGIYNVKGYRPPISAPTINGNYQKPIYCLNCILKSGATVDTLQVPQQNEGQTPHVGDDGHEIVLPPHLDTALFVSAGANQSLPVSIENKVIHLHGTVTGATSYSWEVIQRDQFFGGQPSGVSYTTFDTSKAHDINSLDPIITVAQLRGIYGFRLHAYKKDSVKTSDVFYTLGAELGPLPSPNNSGGSVWNNTQPPGIGQSELFSWKGTTKAPGIIVLAAQTGSAHNYPGSIGVIVNDSIYKEYKMGDYNWNEISIPFGDTTLKKVELIPAHYSSTTGTLPDIYTTINGVFCSSKYTLNPVPQTKTTGGVLFYGHSLLTSIEPGDMFNSMPTLLRRKYGFDPVYIEGYGGRNIKFDTEDSARRADIINRIAAKQPDVFMSLQDRNDWGHYFQTADWTLSKYIAAYKSFLQDIKLRLPKTRFFVHGMVWDVTPSIDGVTINDVRNAEKAMALQIGSIYIDPTQVTDSSLIIDGTHGGTAFHAYWAAHLAPILIPQAVPVAPAVTEIPIKKKTLLQKIFGW